MGNHALFWEIKTMRYRITRKSLDEMVAIINRTSKTQYTLSYAAVYGGYLICRGDMGNSTHNNRYSARELHAYLNGMILVMFDNRL